MNKSELISKFEHHLILKNYSENTVRSYVNGLNIFLRYITKNKVDKVSGNTLESFFHHSKTEMNYSFSMMKQLLASIKFLYHEVLKQPIDFDFNIKMKKPSTLPEVLSIQEVERFMNSFSNLKHKAIFTLCYSAV